MPSKYFTRKRFQGNSLNGAKLNIPFGTELDCIEFGGYEVLFHGDVPICYPTSQVVKDHFVSNDDEQGEQRAKLITKIRNTLEKHDDKHQDRWDLMWNDDVAPNYRNKSLDDHWLWDTVFYSAPIIVLQHIWGKLNSVKNKKSTKENTK